MMIYYICFLIAVIIGSSSQIILKRSAITVSDYKFKFFFNKSIFIAYSLMLVSLAINLYAYRGIALKIGATLENFGFILIMFYDRVFFKEHIHRKQIVGVLLVIIGILFIVL